MGIKDLSKLIQSEAPGACQIKRLKDFRGQILAVDVSNLMYQFAYNPQAKKPKYHLAGFFQLVHELAQAEVMPLMILDGTPDQAKSHILIQRQAEKDRKQTRLDELQATVDSLSRQVSDGSSAKALIQAQSQVKQIDKQIIEVSQDMWTEVKALFKLLGVPCLEATGEADILASQLSAKGLIGGIISEDMDHLVFGAKVLIRDFNNKRSPDLRVYSLETLLTELKLSSDQLIDVGILCGCDYSPKINGIAWKRAHELIKQNGSIETILTKIEKRTPGFEKFEVPAEFNYMGARTMFKAGDPMAKLAKESGLMPGSFEAMELKFVLMNNCNYRDTTLEPKFEVIQKFYQKWNSPKTDSLEQSIPVKIPAPKPKLKVV